jgi:hypothetical protein
LLAQPTPEALDEGLGRLPGAQEADSISLARLLRAYGKRPRGCRATK